MPRKTSKGKSSYKSRYKRCKQRGGFLSRHDFAYARRDTVNQLSKIAPGVIKDASSQINNFTKQCIIRGITQGDKELERVLSKILCRAIEDVYQTPFRLLENFDINNLAN